MLFGEQGFRFPTIPEMVAGGNNMHAKIEQRLGVFLRYSLPFRAILTVRDTEVDFVLLDILFEQRGRERQAGLAVDITDKKDVKMLGHGE